jgi:hypothetical protein
MGAGMKSLSIAAALAAGLFIRAGASAATIEYSCVGKDGPSFVHIDPVGIAVMTNGTTWRDGTTIPGGDVYPPEHHFVEISAARIAWGASHSDSEDPTTATIRGEEQRMGADPGPDRVHRMEWSIDRQTGVMHEQWFYSDGQINPKQPLRTTACTLLSN